MTRDYFVRVYHQFYHDIKLSGKNKQDIVDQVNKMLAENDPALENIYYYGTVKEDYWLVSRQKDVDKILAEKDNTKEDYDKS